MSCRHSAAATLAVLAALLALASWPLGWIACGVALTLFAAIGAIVLARLAHHAPQTRFGVANTVTAARAAAVALLFGIWAGAAPVPPWTVIAIATAVLAADGIDGWLARRSGLASRFGARFDMEVDALLVLALALIVFAAARAGAFVILSGALRYLYVAAGRLVPMLAAPLAPSRRRQTICVAQVGLLVAALAPPVPSAVANGLAALGLALLTYSFAADGLAGLSAPRQLLTSTVRRRVLS
ncbi:MAG TPA: CDP-alcohol phosphatidyltransferase family protein [Stellaceae bacterium]|nr:CDP-alcohol phosphatidyltransferase family protein [Stellaceae bacterium]